MSDLVKLIYNGPKPGHEFPPKTSIIVRGSRPVKIGGTVEVEPDLAVDLLASEKFKFSRADETPHPAPLPEGEGAKTEGGAGDDSPPVPESPLPTGEGQGEGDPPAETADPARGARSRREPKGR